MKYLVLLFASYNDNKQDKKAIYEAATSDEAVALFHSYLGSYMKDDTVSHVMCMAVGTDGRILKDECYTRPVEPEPIIEPVEEEQPLEV